MGDLCLPGKRQALNAGGGASGAWTSLGSLGTGSSLAGDAVRHRLRLMTASEPLSAAEVTEKLKASESDVRALGVRRLALFGSVLHGDARPDSDVDMLVEFDPGEKTYTRFLGLCDLLEAVLGRRVELVTVEALSPFLGPRILAEAKDVLRAA